MIKLLDTLYHNSSVDFYLYHKGKGHPRTGHEGAEGEWRYSATLSLTSALDGVGGQRHAPAALPPGKTRYPLYRRLGGPQGWSGRVWKILPTTGIRSPERPARGKSLYWLSYPDPHLTELPRPTPYLTTPTHTILSYPDPHHTELPRPTPYWTTPTHTLLSYPDLHLTELPRPTPYWATPTHTILSYPNPHLTTAHSLKSCYLPDLHTPSSDSLVGLINKTINLKGTTSARVKVGHWTERDMTAQFAVSFQQIHKRRLGYTNVENTGTEYIVRSKTFTAERSLYLPPVLI